MKLKRASLLITLLLTTLLLAACNTAASVPDASLDAQIAPPYLPITLPTVAGFANSLAVDANNVYTVRYNKTSRKSTLLRLETPNPFGDPLHWEQIAGADMSEWGSVVLDRTGEPVISSVDTVTTAGSSALEWNLHLQKQVGSTWTDIAPPLNLNVWGSDWAHTFELKFAFDASGYPIVVWIVANPGFKSLYVRRFDGTAWVNLGEQSQYNGFNNSLQLNDETVKHNKEFSFVLGSNGYPVVAWSEETRSENAWHYLLTVKGFDGRNWVCVGPCDLRVSSNSNVDAKNPSLTLDPSGKPILAWNEATCTGNSCTNKIYVKRFNDTSWVNVAPAIDTGNAYVRELLLTLDASGTPAIAWTASSLYAKRLEGGIWKNIPGYPLNMSMDGIRSRTVYLEGLTWIGNTITLAWQDSIWWPDFKHTWQYHVRQHKRTN